MSTPRYVHRRAAGLGLLGFLALAAVATATGPTDSPVTATEPAASPITYVPVDRMHPVDAAVFERSRAVVGNVFKHPSFARVCELGDARPFGAAAARTVDLVRFDAVPVRSPDGWRSATVRLYLAFDKATGDLACAFTEPQAAWVPSITDPATLEARTLAAGWDVAPTRGALVSPVTDVLEAVWRRFGLDPAETGQVVIRPRFVANAYPADERNGELIPRYPPANVWIVEVLGTVVLEKNDAHGERVLTTLVAQFRDGDLAALPSIMLP